MKKSKIFSIVLVLLLAFSFGSQKINAQKKDGIVGVKGHFASDGFCDPGGSGCTIVYLEPIVLLQ